MTNQIPDRLERWSLAGSVLIVCLLLAFPSVAVASTSNNPNQTNCPTSVLNPQIDRITLSEPTQNALDLAEQYLATKGWLTDGIVFNSMFSNWRFNQNTCVVALQSIGVAYDSNSKNATIVVTVNPASTLVMGVTVTPATTKGITYWSGYQFNVANSYDVQARWSVPSSSNPDTNYCWNGHLNECDLAIWTGESTSYGGGSGFAQGGTDSSVDCHNIGQIWSCVSTYDMWYEFPPAKSVACGSTPSPNDDILGDMSWSSNTENIYVYDYNSGSACSASKSGISAPSWEQFMFEFPQWTSCYGYCSGYYYLPQFSQASFWDAYVSSVPINQLSNPQPAYMTNAPGGGYNINLGAISYNRYVGAYFQETWQTSSGT